MKKVPRKCIEFDKRLNETNVTLRELKGYKVESLTPMATREVKRMSEYLKDAKSKLEGLKSMTEGSSKMGRLYRAKRVSEALDELIDGLEKLKMPGLVIDSSAHQATLLQASSSAEKDVFTAQYNVPPTPTELVLELNNSLTYEGQLKEKSAEVACWNSGCCRCTSDCGTGNEWSR